MSNEQKPTPDINEAMSAWLAKQEKMMKNGAVLAMQDATDVALEVHEFIRARGFSAHPGVVAEGLFVAMQLVGGVSHAARIAGQFSRDSRS